MAMLPYSQIGDNLYADSSGKQFNIVKGYRQYVQSPFDTQSQKLNQVYDMQRKNQLDLLKQQRDRAVSGFNQQKKDLAPQYQNQRNQADVVNSQNVSRLRELMAANGISASGENVTAQTNLASARQTSLNDINNNEQSAYKEIDRQIADVNDPGQEQAIIAAIEAERARALADAQAQYQQDLYNRQIDWRNFAFEKEKYEYSKKHSGGGGGGGGRRSSGRKSGGSNSGSSGTSNIKTKTNTKPSTAQSNLKTYYQQPIPYNQRYLYDEYGLVQPSVNNNPNLSEWDKMKLLGL